MRESWSLPRWVVLVAWCGLGAGLGWRVHLGVSPSISWDHVSWPKAWLVSVHHQQGAVVVFPGRCQGLCRGRDSLMGKTVTGW